jgi:hypothetical protein
MIQTGQLNIQRARQAQETILRSSVLAGTSGRSHEGGNSTERDCPGRVFANIKVPVELNDSEKTQFINDWCTFRENSSILIKHRGAPRQNEAGYGLEYSEKIT